MVPLAQTFSLIILFIGLTVPCQIPFVSSLMCLERTRYSMLRLHNLTLVYR